MRLRPLRPAEMAALRALHDASFDALGAAYGAAVKAAHAALVAEPAYAEEVARCDPWVAEGPDGRLLASAGWCEQEGRCRIRKVFVHPDAARQGFATRLVRAAEERSGLARFTLRAYLDAVPLYGKLGYRAVAPARMALPGGLSMPVLMMERP
ncbi:GNAT family N-acetyltransferase [Roseococcus sp. DSY-14]|uniref:GNAT family N-acetyltransferase n=1 Tax=Roseococcus sp. DSY-14 TaxID=3369650 RepID=UPI00387B2B82